MDVEDGFEPAVESRAVAIVAGPIVPLAREQRARIATPSVWTLLTPPAAPRSSSRPGLKPPQERSPRMGRRPLRVHAPRP
jgi:hypothetical protein